MSNQGDLPKGWVIARIEEIGDTSTGGTPSRRRIDYFGGEIPWLKSGELEDGIIYDTEEKITVVGLEESAAKWFPPGAICIALYGATVGKLAILGIPAATNQAICGIFLPPDIDTKYVFRYLESIRRDLIGQGRGGAQSNISNAIIRQTLVPLAPVLEQRRIVAKIEELFSDLDAGVAALQRAKAKLKRYRAAVLKAAVEGRLTEHWRAENPAQQPASELLKRILKERRKKWEEDQLAAYEAKRKQPPTNWRDKYREPAGPGANLSALPEGWCWATIEQLNPADRTCAYGVLQPGPDVEGGIPFVRVCDIADGNVFVDQLKHIAPKISNRYKRTLLQGGEVLLTIVGTIGRTAVAPDTLKGANTARAVAVIPIAEPIIPRFIEVMLRDPRMRNRLTKAAHEVARKTLNLEDVRAACLPIAPLNEQCEIISLVEAQMSVIDEVEAEIDNNAKRSHRLRQSILKRAFKGRLVPQDPTDEPASVLLERIKTAAVDSGTFKGNRKSAGNNRRPAAAKDTEISR
jgi:type I restriction enzyme, S subunit